MPLLSDHCFHETRWPNVCFVTKRLHSVRVHISIKTNRRFGFPGTLGFSDLAERVKVTFLLFFFFSVQTQGRKQGPGAIVPGCSLLLLCCKPGRRLAGFTISLLCTTPSILNVFITLSRSSANFVVSCVLITFTSGFHPDRCGISADCFFFRLKMNFYLEDFVLPVFNRWRAPDRFCRLVGQTNCFCLAFRGP